jgi:hypothetical protein
MVFPHAEELIQNMQVRVDPFAFTFSVTETLPLTFRSLFFISLSLQTAIFNSTTDPLDPYSDPSYHPINGSVRRETKPNYNITNDDMAAARAIQELVHSHLTMVAQAAKEVASEVLKEQMEAFELRVKANLEKIEKLKLHSKGTIDETPLSLSLSLPLQETQGAHEGDQLRSANEDQERGEVGQLSETTIPFQMNIVSLPCEGVTEGDVVPTLESSHPHLAARPPQDALHRSVSLPFPSPSSIIVGAGNVIPIVSLQSLFINTSESKLLFLRRFVTTQVLSLLLTHSLTLYFSLDLSLPSPPSPLPYPPSLPLPLLPSPPLYLSSPLYPLRCTRSMIKRLSISCKI